MVEAQRDDAKGGKVLLNNDKRFHKMDYPVSDELVAASRTKAFVFLIICPDLNPTDCHLVQIMLITNFSVRYSINRSCKSNFYKLPLPDLKLFPIDSPKFIPF